MVLEFYRARWQVELAFKRLKSLSQMGQLPKKKEASCRAWMQGKILTALLIERLLCEARFFSPLGLSTLKSKASGACLMRRLDGKGKAIRYRSRPALVSRSPMGPVE